MRIDLPQVVCGHNGGHAQCVVPNYNHTSIDGLSDRRIFRYVNDLVKES